MEHCLGRFRVGKPQTGRDSSLYTSTRRAGFDGAHVGLLVGLQQPVVLQTHALLGVELVFVLV